MNSAPLTPRRCAESRARGLLEYTCVNWIRTAPYVKAWNRDYAPLGLVVIGVHAPEFEFGKRAENIDRGIRDHRIDAIPIAIDNDFAIWRAFGNDAWPAKYLFDDRGRLVRRWVGEGSYDEIEREIRRLLVAAQPGAQLPAVSERDRRRSRRPANLPTLASRTRPTSALSRRELGAVTLKGDWHTDRQYVELKKGSGEIVLPFTARRGEPRHATRAVGTCRRHSAARWKASRRRARNGRRHRRSRALRSIGDDPLRRWQRRRCDGIKDPILDRRRAARVCLHLRSPIKPQPSPSPSRIALTDRSHLPQMSRHNFLSIRSLPESPSRLMQQLLDFTFSSSPAGTELRRRR